MSDPSDLRELSSLVDEYLAFRVARGFQPSRKLERVLKQFVDAVPAGHPGGQLFTQGQALAWAHAPAGAPAWVAWRLSAVRQFAVYLAGSGLPVGVPGTRQGPGGSFRATPYLFSDGDIRAVMSAADHLFTPLRAATMKTLVGVMAVTGMRIGEVLQLKIADLDLDHGVVLIANAKFGRQRLVHLHHSSCQAIDAYLRLPVRHRVGVAPERPVLVTRKGTAVPDSAAHGALHQMVLHADLPPRAGARPRPRPHDLRHTFATRSMIDAYRSGRDPARTLTLLSVWLGHANPADTYWYLQAAPEVAALAALLLEPDTAHTGTGRREGGRS